MKIKCSLTTAFLVGALATHTFAFEFDTVIVGGRPDGDPLGPQLGTGIDWDDNAQTAWRLNEAGHVVFSQQLDDLVPNAADGTLWRWSNGSKTLLARENEQAPGLPDGVLINSLPASFEGLDLASDGAVAVVPSLKGSGVTTNSDTAFMFFAADGTIKTPVREGGSIPGLSPLLTFGYSGGVPLAMGGRSLSPDGQFMFESYLVGPGVNNNNDNVLFLGSPDNPALLVREGDPAPGVTPDAVFRFENASDRFRIMNSGDRQVFAATVANPNATYSRALFLHGPGTLTPLVTTESSTGLSGVDFRSPNADTFPAPQVNSAGDVTFTGRYVNNVVSNGLYKVSAGSSALQLLVVQGIAAPGTGENFGFNPIGQNEAVEHILTESGYVAFTHALAGLTVTTANDTGIWINDARGTRLAIREGDAAGDLAGATIGALRQFTFNDNQNLIVVTDLVGNVSSANDRAMWLVRADGHLELMLREGDLFDVDPTTNVDNRTIANLELGGYKFARDQRFSGAFNDHDVLAFSLDFTDGHSGIFLTNVGVPEPSTFVIVALGLVPLVAVGCRRKL